MRPPEWVQRVEWDVSQIADSDAWLFSVFEFAGLGPETGPGEDYVWRTIMMDPLDGVSRPNSREPKPIREDATQLFRKSMRREHVDASTLTKDQAEFICGGPFRLGDTRLDLETLSDQVTYIVRHWPKSIGFVNRGRTLFKTVKGMFGFGPVTIQAGDVVTLLWGVRSPIILRPRESDDDASSFDFIGDAYVNGIMYGDFLKTGPTGEDFDIY